MTVLTLGLLLFLSAAGYASTYYISPTGNDVAGNGSYDNPYRTPNNAISKMVGGDILIYKNGTYEGNDFALSNPPSGSVSGYTTIKAEDDFQVIINFHFESGIVLS
jgi:hypothetical protein